MIETSPLLRAMLSKTAFLTACGNWELPSPLGDTEPPRRNFFVDEVSHQKRGAAKMIHYIVSYLKNSRMVWNIHLVAFFCVCFATPFIVFAERGSFHDDERTVLLPPLRKTLSTDGKTKARALALFAKGYGEMRKKRLLTPKAEKAFLDALRLNPELKGPLQILLKEWTRGRKPKLLLEKLLPIAKQHPDAVNLNLVVANTMRILGKSDDALNLLENTFTALFTDAPKKEVSPELKTKLVFNLLDLTAEKKLWNKGEETLETVFSSPKLSKNLIARIAAAKFFAKCADVGPDGFFAGWSKRRRKRLLKKNLAIIEKLCSTENVPAPTLLAICKIYKRYSMRGRAEQLLLTQLLNNPNSPSSMLVLAKVFDANKDYANEMRAWKIMINSKKYADIKKAWSKTHPTKASSTELYFQLGLAAIKANDWSEALAAFDWRLLNAPDDVATIFQLGLVQMRMGKFRKALYHFDKLDKLPFALYFAALCHRALEEYELSFEAISESERLAKKLKFNTILNEGFYIDYAFIADKAGEFKITRTILETLLKNNPDDPMLNNFLGYALAEKGVELKKAKKLISKALEKETDNEAYLDSMAWALYKQNRLEGALAFINKALAASGDLPDAVIADHAGDINLAAGKPVDALKYWKLAQGIYSKELDDKLVAAKIRAATPK